MRRKQTFIVDVYENQNESWQGKLLWVQGQKEEIFRSVIELLSLMDSAICTEDKGSQYD